MIDTNTVNFAITKLSSAMTSIAPTLTSISEEYVSYVVSQQIALFILALFAMIAIPVIYFKLLKAFKKDKYYGEGNITILNVITGIGYLFIIILFCCQSVDTFLAVTNPKMYTIQKVIESAKN